MKIGGRSFAAADARVQMIVPNPLNPGRYVLVAAAASAGAMQLWTPDALRNAEFDFTIEDGHVASGKERTSRSQIWVAGGWFDQRWQVADALVVAGDSAVRSKSPVLRASRPEGEVDAKILDSYVGKYEIIPTLPVKVTRSGNRLIAQVADQPPLEMLPISDTEFYIPQGPAEIAFQKGDSGAITAFKGWQNGQEFLGKKVE